MFNYKKKKKATLEDYQLENLMISNYSMCFKG